jgi:hypothetical protein
MWGELVVSAIRKHQDLIRRNHGVKEANVCKLLAPVGFDVRRIDPILLADLDAFSTMRGGHAHRTHSEQLTTILDPFDRKAKAEALLQLISVLDADLVAFERSS